MEPIQTTARPGVAQELNSSITMAMQKSRESNKAFAVITLQIENLEIFRRRQTPSIANKLLNDLLSNVRRAVHPSQYVCVFRDGLGLVLDGVDLGMVDTVAQRLLTLSQHVIRAGQYNDLAAKWSEIIYQFLFPARPGLLYTKIGWAIYPRDGESATELTARAIKHANELSGR